MAEAKTTKAATSKGRGIGFPFLSLPEAVKIVRDAGSYGKQHSASALASYAGHATANSGPFKQKLAALREWGFITTSNGEVSLTDAAMHIAYPTAPDETAQVLMAAFRGCGIFWKTYEDTAKGIPLKPELIANGAVTRYQIGVGSKDRFMKSFLESAEAVGLAQRMPNGEIQLLTAAQATPSKVHEEHADTPEDRAPHIGAIAPHSS